MNLWFSLFLLLRGVNVLSYCNSPKVSKINEGEILVPFSELIGDEKPNSFFYCKLRVAAVASGLCSLAKLLNDPTVIFPGVFRL